ncbi:MAG TPA: DUF1990 domain-containing protein [Blastocatellia bacterium]|nr:DUF1990 domain-containing protein [Blastocatellia bacterium]
MFLLHRPSDEEIRKVLERQKDQPLSYAGVDFKNYELAHGFNIDHHHVRLGKGPEVFSKSIDAIKRWEMFNIGWLSLCWPDALIEPDSIVAVLARHLGFWSLNACRIVRVIDENGPDRRYGFVYGTLSEHAECGEERFTVEWRREDDTVWYDILAYSRPNQLLAKLGYPIARSLQKRFAKDSMAAVVRSVE